MHVYIIGWRAKGKGRDRWHSQMQHYFLTLHFSNAFSPFLFSLFPTISFSYAFIVDLIHIQLPCHVKW